jgi:hypothetical protein
VSARRHSLLVGGHLIYPDELFVAKDIVHCPDVSPYTLWHATEEHLLYQQKMYSSREVLIDIIMQISDIVSFACFKSSCFITVPKIVILAIYEDQSPTISFNFIA